MPNPALLAYVDQASRSHPYPLLDELRAASPFIAQDGVVVVARHAECWRLLRDPRMSSERDRARVSPARNGPRTRNFLHLDPPDHTRCRRLVAKAFTPRVVAALGPRIRTVANELLDAGMAEGRLEVVSQFAYPLPLRVMCELLGVDFADHELLQIWSGSLAEALEPPLPGLTEPATTKAAARARADFIRYFRDLIAARRLRPRDDLVSHLVHVSADGDQLTESELLSTCILLINAGHETTVNLIANGVLALLRHPDQLELLRADPESAVGAVEEVLRYDAPVHLTTRVATAPLMVGDTPIEAGDLVVMLLAAANRDPERFPDPDRFDVRRPDASQHLSFAAGPHFCLGAGLARLEVQVAFELLASRLANLRTGATEVTYKPNLSLRGPARLDVEFDARIAPSPAPVGPSGGGAR